MSTIAVNAITDANGGATTTINSVTPNTSNLVGKNLIINGNMLIDQRQAGAASTADNSRPLDRYNFRTVGGGGVSVVQSTEVPAGFKNSMAVTVATADTSIAASDVYMLRQSIEGLNTYQLDFGKSTAKTITLSFWVRSSLTGTFGGCIANYAANRSNVFQYTISTANTWEKKSITIAGDTTGTWLTNNSGSLVLYFDWGSGSNYDGTANQWDAANKRRVSGNVNLIGTLGATWYITGVQLEAGDTATEFEHRPYGTELQLCQRYYLNACSVVTTTSQYLNHLRLPVQMRTNPSVGTITFDGGSGATFNITGTVNINQHGLSLYQGANHSIVATATKIPLSAEL